TIKSLGRTLLNQGTGTWSGGGWQFIGGTLDNEGAFTLEATSFLDGFGDGAPGAFNNSGTFIKQGTSEARFRVNNTGISFNNSGTVDVRAGTLGLDAGGSHSNDFTVQGGATLRLGGNHTFAATA